MIMVELVNSYIFSFIYVQWKFAFMSMGRPEYLQDSDVVYNRFQVFTSSHLVFFYGIANNIRDLTRL